MKRTTTTAMSLVGLGLMLVLGVFSGSASASEFLYTGPLPGLILVLNDNVQIFKPAPGTFQVECRHFAGHGILSATRMSEAEQIVTGSYSKCEITGGSKATITPVEYLIGANGTVSVLNTIVITAGSPGNCSIKVNPGASNSNLSKILFLNNPGGDLLLHVEVTGIHSTASNGLCGETGVEKTEGSYFGLLLVWADKGGTIKWDP